MEDSEKEIESTKEYGYCKICRHNFNNGKKHFYTNKHDTNLKRILSNMCNKVNECKNYLSKPLLIQININNNDEVKTHESTKFWCYFCANEFKKGSIIEPYYYCKYNSMIEHFKSQTHDTSCIKFFKKYRLNDSKEIKIGDYLIDDDEYLEYLENLNKSIEIIDDQIKSKVKQESEKIKQQEHQRKSLVYWSTINAINTKRKITSDNYVNDSNNHKLVKLSSNNGKLDNDNESILDQVDFRGVNMTYIGRKESTLNIFTGATPPWLESNILTNEQTVSSIGPTINEFNAQKKEEWHKKLPETRLGYSKVNDSYSKNWLPKFSGVWNRKNGHKN